MTAKKITKKSKKTAAKKAALKPKTAVKTAVKKTAAKKISTKSLWRVGKSTVHGRGIFPTADIARGERIIEYKGERISNTEADRRGDDAAGDAHHTFLFAISEKVVLDASRFGNEARFINHCCSPNCEAEVKRGRVYIYAKRKIPANAELFYDYSYVTDDSYSDAELRRLYPCRCGSPKCRKTIAAVGKARQQSW